MAAEGPKSLAFFLLLLNLVLYVIVLIIAGWAINFSIDHTPHTASQLTIPVELFPMYVPIGNMVTGFFIIFSFLTGLVGFAVSIDGINNVFQWTAASLLSASTFSLIAWFLTLLAMGFGCKEIDTGGRDGSLRTLEGIMIILSVTQLLCSAAIHIGVTTLNKPRRTGRV